MPAQDLDLGESLRFSKAVTGRDPAQPGNGEILADLGAGIDGLAGTLHAGPRGRRQRLPPRTTLAGWLGAHGVRAGIESLRRNWTRIALVTGVLCTFLLNAPASFGPLLAGEPSAPTLAAIARTPQFQLLLVVGAVLCVCLPVVGPLGACATTAACGAGIVYLGLDADAQGPPSPMGYALLTVVSLFAVSMLVGYLAERRSRRRLVATFGHYAAPELVRRLTRDREPMSLASEAREMSVMFCDVRDFTSICEQLAPKDVAELLNALLSPLTRIIYERGGNLDKYMGDAIMAMWGAPVPDPRHAANAVGAAFDIQAALVELRHQFRARGWPEIEMGIGINSGVMNVGNMGSEYRVAYTVVGDSVNVAAKLQKLTRAYRARILVGEKTKQAFPAATYREIGVVGGHGKQSPARVFEPCHPALDPLTKLVAHMNVHDQALGYYRARQWDQARALFRRLRESHPGDLLYEYYLARIETFRRQPPPEGWQGEIVLHAG